MKRAILLSGGMDSTALCYQEKPEVAITLDYGQRPANAEIYSASKVAEAMGIEHHIIKIDCSSLGTGDLVNTKQLNIGPSREWWPFRNQLLITLASMKAIKLGIQELLIGSVKTDSFHQDGTQQFYSLINSLTSYQEGSIRILAPAVNQTTTQLIKSSDIPLNILLWAHSCHTSNQPCLRCRGCEKYLLTLQELNIEIR